MRDTRMTLRVAAIAGATLLTAVVAGGCTGSSGSRQPDESPDAWSAALDSIVLERTVCFGFCPAYRVRISGSGQVRFSSTNPRDTAATHETDSIPIARVSTLLREARAIGFFELPSEIDPSHPETCPVVATDHPSAIVTIALGDSIKRVHHYHGCYVERNGEPTDAYAQLTAFEAAIDSAVRVNRWLPRRD